MGSGNKVKQISVQLHPNDEYCLQHEGEKGKFECGIFVQGDRDHLAIRGHNAKTREEFRKLVETEQWDKLFRVVTIKKGTVYIWSPGNPSWFSICTDRRRKRYGGAWI